MRQFAKGELVEIKPEDEFLESRFFKRKLTDEEHKARARTRMKIRRAEKPDHVRAITLKANKKWRADKPDSYNAVDRKYRLKRYYGISVSEYDAMLVKQNNCCAICKVSAPGGMGRWHIDHCHKTKAIRGLLCRNCNSGLGHFKDNTCFLRAAIDYLKEFTS